MQNFGESKYRSILVPLDGSEFAEHRCRLRSALLAARVRRFTSFACTCPLPACTGNVQCPMTRPWIGD
jgi:hypothetical protein